LFGSHCLHQTSLLSFVRVTLYQAQACYHAWAWGGMLTVMLLSNLLIKSLSVVNSFFS
jgi:hypothetical protein